MGLSFLNLLWATNTIKESIPTAESIAKAILDEQEMRKMEEEAYWKGWDMAFKKKVIERLRNHEEGANLLTFKGVVLYPHISQDQQADMFENGDLKLIDLVDKKVVLAIWSDESRSEAQLPAYLERMEQIRQDMSTGHYRIIT